MITSACTARIMSNHLDEREKAWQLIHSPAVVLSPDKESFAAMVREALYTGNIIAYAPVSYTHLDVYKRQLMTCSVTAALRL